MISPNERRSFVPAACCETCNEIYTMSTLTITRVNIFWKCIVLLEWARFALCFENARPGYLVKSRSLASAHHFFW